jgi:hypothetical protein
MSEVKLPGEAKQNKLPPECGQPIDVGDIAAHNRNSLFKTLHADI